MNLEIVYFKLKYYIVNFDDLKTSDYLTVRISDNTIESARMDEVEIYRGNEMSDEIAAINRSKIGNPTDELKHRKKADFYFRRYRSWWGRICRFYLGLSPTLAKWDFQELFTQVLFSQINHKFYTGSPQEIHRLNEISVHCAKMEIVQSGKGEMTASDFLLKYPILVEKMEDDFDYLFREFKENYLKLNSCYDNNLSLISKKREGILSQVLIDGLLKKYGITEKISRETFSKVFLGVLRYSDSYSQKTVTPKTPKKGNRFLKYFIIILLLGLGLGWLYKYKYKQNRQEATVQEAGTEIMVKRKQKQANYFYPAVERLQKSQKTLLTKAQKPLVYHMVVLETIMKLNKLRIV